MEVQCLKYVCYRIVNYNVLIFYQHPLTFHMYTTCTFKKKKCGMIVNDVVISRVWLSVRQAIFCKIFSSCAHTKYIYILLTDILLISKICRGNIIAPIIYFII